MFWGGGGGRVGGWVAPPAFLGCPAARGPNNDCRVCPPCNPRPNPQPRPRRPFPPQVVIFRDGKYLTLAEVFESLRLTSHELNVDALDMHADKNTFHRWVFLFWSGAAAWRRGGGGLCARRDVFCVCLWSPPPARGWHFTRHHAHPSTAPASTGSTSSTTRSASRGCGKCSSSRTTCCGAGGWRS